MNEFEPTNFNGCYSADELKNFLVKCANHNVSDVLIQGGDYIWLDRYGRQVKGSISSVENGNIPIITEMLWRDNSILINVNAGVDQDRGLEISPTSENDYGLERGKTIRFRCNFVQAHVAKQMRTVSITIRIIPQDLPTFDTVHLEDELKDAMYPRDGLILICGPTGSGKTTLQAAIYHYALVNLPDKKIVTYEDPIEYVLGGRHCNGPQPAQSQVGRDVVSFAAGIRNAMRRALKIIGIGEARDRETFKALIQAATSGHLCYGTMHTKSCADTIARVIQEFPTEEQSSVAADLLNTLHVVIVQNLLRTTDGKRIAVREYIVFDLEIKREMQNMPYQSWGNFIRQYLEDRKGTIADKAWDLYIDNKISKEEFIEKAGLIDFNRRFKECTLA
ncbi:plasmid transfer ATPase TraJ [Xenorhabdus nematophila]|uniref:plasmid transfer ATPase TraJ n=1 Tax=Xenorhabdus nematophila TaxID=628 RepID=UPI0032B7B7F6